MKLEEFKQGLMDQAKKLRERGCEDPLYVVPSHNIRCFVPCDIGRCICVGINGWTVVNESGMIRSRREVADNVNRFSQWVAGI